MSNDKNYKHKQQDLTELNADGNRDRGQDGEDLKRRSYTFKYEDIFEEIEDDPDNVNMKIPEEIAEKIGLKPGDPVRILKGDQGTIIIEKVKYDEEGQIIPSDVLN